jgi:hypothetical protein
MADFVPGAPAATMTSWSKTPHDGFSLGGGVTVGALDTDALYVRLVALGISVDHTAGRADNIAKFVAERSARFNAAGQAAVEAWLGGGRA